MRLIRSDAPWPRRIGCWRVDAALVDYLAARLELEWSGVSLPRFDDAQALQRERVDAWLLGEAPSRQPRAPALVLGPLTRSETLESLAERVWRIGLPATGRRLQQSLRAVLQA